MGIIDEQYIEQASQRHIQAREREETSKNAAQAEKMLAQTLVPYVRQAISELPSVLKKIGKPRSKKYIRSRFAFMKPSSIMVWDCGLISSDAFTTKYNSYLKNPFCWYMDSNGAIYLPANLVLGLQGKEDIYSSDRILKASSALKEKLIAGIATRCVRSLTTIDETCDGASDAIYKKAVEAYFTL